MAVPGLFVSIPAEIVTECEIHPISERIMGGSSPLDCEIKQMDHEGFDLCVCVLGIKYFTECEKIYQNVKPGLRPGAKFIAYFVESYGYALSEIECKLILSRFHKMQQARVLINGFDLNLAPRIARGSFRLAGWLTEKFWPFGRIGSAALMMVSLPFSRIANNKSECDDKYSPPEICTSVMVEID